MPLTDLIVQRAGSREVRSRYFPELQTTIHVTPWSCAERETAIRAAKDHGFTPRYEIDILILKAVDENGKPLFGPHDRTKLLHQGDPDIIGQICDFLLGPEVFVNEPREVERLGEPSAPPTVQPSSPSSTSPPS
jgi:hypothetical protein